jgi:hypothetical protein
VTAPPPIDGACCYFDTDIFEHVCQNTLSECECLRKVYGYWNPGSVCESSLCETTPPPCDLFCCHIDGEIKIAIGCDPSQPAPTCPPNFYAVSSFGDCVPTTTPEPPTTKMPVRGACCHGFGDSCTDISEFFYGNPDTYQEQAELCLEEHPDGTYYGGLKCSEINCETTTTTTTTTTTQGPTTEGPEVFGACCDTTNGGCFNLVGTLDYIQSVCTGANKAFYQNVSCQEIDCSTYTTTTTTTSNPSSSTTTTTTASPASCGTCCLGDLSDPDSVISVGGGNMTPEECANIGGICSEIPCDDLINPPSEPTTTTTTTTTTAIPTTSEATTQSPTSCAICCACCDQGVEIYIPTGEVDSNGQPCYTCHSSCEIVIEGNPRCANILIQCPTEPTTTTTQEPFLMPLGPNI